MIVGLRRQLAFVATIAIAASVLVGATVSPAFASGADATLTATEFHRAPSIGQMVLDNVTTSIIGYDGPSGTCGQMRPCSASLEGRLDDGGAAVQLSGLNFYYGQIGPDTETFLGTVNVAKINAMRVNVTGSGGTSTGDWTPVVDHVPKPSISAVINRFDRDASTTNTVWNVSANVQNYVSAASICTNTTCQLKMKATFVDGTTEDIQLVNLSPFSNQGSVSFDSQGGLDPIGSIQIRLEGATQTLYGQTLGVEDNAGQILDGESVGGANPAENICHCENGDPVNSATGEFYQSATDLSLPGKGPAVAASRTYSSTNGGTDGSFGYGWADSFSSRLTVLTPGDVSDPLPRKVQVVQENGSTVVFNENSAHHYVAPPRVLAALTFDAGTSQWTFTWRTVLSMTFDSAGDLLTQSDPNGNTVNYTYSSGHVSTISGPGGRLLTLVWASGHVTGITDQASRTVSYGYTSGNLTSVRAVDGAVTHYGYAAGHYLTTVENPEGGVTTNVYDTSHRVASQTDPLDRETTFAYGDNTTTVTDPAGAVTKQNYYGHQLVSVTHGYGTSIATTTTFEHDPAGNTVSITDGVDAVTEMTYDVRGNQLTSTDPLGHITATTYNSLNRVTSVTDPLDRDRTFTYDSDGNRLTETSPGERVEHWSYNADGTVDTSTDARGKVTTYTYNTAGNLTSSTDPDSRVRHIAYDGAGHQSSTTDSEGEVTAFTTDDAGRVLTVTDPNNHTTTNTYDGDGNLLATEDPNSHTVSRTYDDADQLTSVTDARGKTTAFTYTDAGLLASTTDPNSHSTISTYNGLGQLTSETDANSHVTSYIYDDAGRKLSTELPSGKTSSMSYDAAGRMTASTDGRGKVTHYTYDPAGELVSTTDPLTRVTSQTYTDDGQPDTTTLPDSSTEIYAYNANGQQTGFTNADGKHTAYVFDDAGLLTSKTEPGGITTGYSYDTAGRLHVTTKPDGTSVTDTHDDAGQLTREHSSMTGSTDITYTYDPAGQRATMTDQTGTTTYSYNANNQSTSVTNGNGATIGYGYDAAGRRITITYPGSHTVSNGYDAADHLTSVTDWASRETDFTWTVDGNLHTQADANGVTETRAYDNNNQTTSISDATSTTPLTTFSYGYDDAGQLTSDSATDSTGTHPHNYAYDPLNQLTTVGNGSTSSAFAATSAGQLVADTSGNTLAYNSAQELTSSTPTTGPATTFAYDDNGSRTSSTLAAAGSTPAATTSYSYDPQGNLAIATIPGAASTTVAYTSDGDGLRQSRTVGSTTKQFLWDTSGSLPVLLDDGDHTYLYGPSAAPIAQIDDTSSTIQYLHGDLVGSTRLITSGSGVEAATITYDPYGNRTGHTGTADTRIGYTGNWTDPATALIDLRAREYDPATSQFTVVDPAVGTTRHPYAYVANNPLQAVDLSGMGACAEITPDYLPCGASTAAPDPRYLQPPPTAEDLYYACVDEWLTQNQFDHSPLNDSWLTSWIVAAARFQHDHQEAIGATLVVLRRV